jgi:hypothetical protein
LAQVPPFDLIIKGLSSMHKSGKFELTLLYPPPIFTTILRLINYKMNW